MKNARDLRQTGKLRFGAGRAGWVAAVAAAAVAGAAAWWFVSRGGGAGSPAAAKLDAAPGAAAGWNLLLITLDTTRADRLGCYGRTQARTPHLDRLAAEGVRFADAVATVPVTLPSHSSIMTGDYPPTHGVRDNGTYRLVESETTLAERLKQEGYATGAFVSAFVLDGRYGLSQGFDKYDDHIRTATGEANNPQRPADAVVDAALEWLKSRRAASPEQPLFAWVHFYDPHSPYSPPEPFKTDFSDPYDGEVAFMDEQIGRLLSEYAAIAPMERTVVAVVGDHGEGLGDHGERTHALLIYDSVMHVPLILRAAGVLPAGLAVTDRVVSTVDLMPTLLELLGLAPEQCDGSSLLRGGAADDDRIVYMETLYPSLNHGWAPLYSARRHRDKYIEAPRPEYFELTFDPGETNNLYDRKSTDADALAARLDEMMARLTAAGVPSSDASVAPDADAMAKLHALGYVGGSEAPVSSTPLDPKDMVLRWQELLGDILQHVQNGEFDAAIPRMREALQMTPNDAEVWSMLSEAQTRRGLYDDAIESLMRKMELQPNANPDDWIKLARLQLSRGGEKDAAAAEVSLQQAERLDPASGGVAMVRAEVALRDGRHQEALELAKRARELDASRQTSDSWLLTGRVHQALGQSAEAQQAFQRAYESNPSDGGAALELARIAFDSREFREAAKLARDISPRRGEWAESRLLLARALLALEQGDRAINVMEKLVKASPQSGWARVNLGNIYYILERYEEAAEAYRGAAEVDEANAIARFGLGNALRRLGQEEQAVEHYHAALEIDPQMHQAAVGLARIDARAGRTEEAVRRLSSLIEQGALTARQIADDPDLASVANRLGAPASQPAP